MVRFDSAEYTLGSCLGQEIYANPKTLTSHQQQNLTRDRPKAYTIFHFRIFKNKNWRKPLNLYFSISDYNSK